MNVLALNRVKVEGMFRGGATVLTRFFRKFWPAEPAAKMPLRFVSGPQAFVLMKPPLAFANRSNMCVRAVKAEAKTASPSLSERGPDGMTARKRGCDAQSVGLSMLRRCLLTQFG